MAETTPQKSKRDILYERISAKYPDKEYADDEALFGQVNDDYDAQEAEINRYKESEGRLTDLLATNPYAGRFIADMASGQDPWLAVIERLGIDGITDLMNDPSKQEEYAEANRKYVERIAKDKELEAEYQANLSESLNTLQQIQQERGLGDETIDAAVSLIMGIVNDAIIGKFSPETIDMALNAVNRDADLENARTEGMVAGRNAKIEEKLRKRSAGDGIPAIGGGNSGVPKPEKKGFLDDLPLRKF